MHSLHKDLHPDTQIWFTYATRNLTNISLPMYNLSLNNIIMNGTFPFKFFPIRSNSPPDLSTSLALWPYLHVACVFVVRYAAKMAEFSGVYKEQADASLPRILWWIEYVLRHGGSQHLHSAALQLFWPQTALLDLVAILVLVIFLSSLLLRCSVRRGRGASVA